MLVYNKQILPEKVNIHFYYLAELPDHAEKKPGRKVINEWAAQGIGLTRINKQLIAGLCWWGQIILFEEGNILCRFFQLLDKKVFN